MPQPLFQYELQGLPEKLKNLSARFGSGAVNQAVLEITRDVTEEVVREARQILNEETNGTGRGAASIGKYDPSYLKLNNSLSSPTDSIWEEIVSREGVQIIAGTNLEYVLHINYGFVQTDTRRVWIEREQRWVTVKPHSFAGLFFAERALGAVQSNPEKIYEIMRQRLAALGIR